VDVVDTAGEAGTTAVATIVVAPLLPVVTLIDRHRGTLQPIGVIPLELRMFIPLVVERGEKNTSHKGGEVQNMMTVLRGGHPSMTREMEDVKGTTTGAIGEDLLYPIRSVTLLL
jgi:hypothetical protein